MSKDYFHPGIFLGSGDAESGQREWHSWSRVDHHWNTEIVSGGENEVAVFAEGIHAMADRVQLEADEVQFLDATLYFATICVVISVGTKARKAKKAAWIFCAKLCDGVMSLYRFFGSGIGLNDRDVDLALINSADQLLFRGCDAENTAPPEMGVRVDYS
jgi:hypothetical protein